MRWDNRVPWMRGQELRSFGIVVGICLSLVLPLALGGGDAVARAYLTTLSVKWVGKDGATLKEATLSQGELQELPQVSFNTRTFWTDGTHQFTGPSIGSIAALGPGRALSARVLGIDDYSASLTHDEWEVLGAILAMWCDGVLMQVRDKGPYWLMFPADSNPSVLYTQAIQEKLVWHVTRIEFLVDR